MIEILDLIIAENKYCSEQSNIDLIWSIDWFIRQMEKTIFTWKFLFVWFDFSKNFQQRWKQFNDRKL